MASGASVLALLRAYKPQLSSPEEQAAFAVHLTLLASGFELVASGLLAEAAASGTSTSTSTSTSTPESSSEDPLQGWRDTPGVFTFLYSCPAPLPTPSSQEPPQQQQQQQQQQQEQEQEQGQGQENEQEQACLKCLVVGDSMMVDACHVSRQGQHGAAGAGLPGQEPQVYHAEFRPCDYVAAAAPPSTPGSSSSSSSSSSYSAMFRDLDALVALISRSICVPLLPGSQGRSPKAQEASDSASALGVEAGTRSAPRSSSTDPAGEGQRGSRGEGDEGGAGPGLVPSEGRHPRGGPDPGLVYPPLPDIPGFGDDLTPGGGAGIMPNRGPVFPGSGMLVGPHDPRWGRMGPGPGLEDPNGLFDPDGGVNGRPGNLPPGIRFDPYGPPGVPGFEPGRFGENRGRRGPPGFNDDLQFFPGGGF